MNRNNSSRQHYGDDDNGRDYPEREQYPLLSPADIGGATDAILKVVEVRIGIRLRGRDGNLVVLDVPGVGKRGMWLNRQDMDDIFQARILGSRLPIQLMEVENPRTGEKLDRFHVEPAAAWPASVFRAPEPATEPAPAAPRARSYSGRSRQ